HFRAAAIARAPSHTGKPSPPRATATIQSRRHPMARLASQLLIALAVLTLTGTTCGRGVSIESDAGPTYTLQVRNPNPFPMSVSYDDGTGERLLGNVGANGEASFVVSRPASTRITITARDRSGERTVRRQVTLRAGAAEVVTLTT